MARKRNTETADAVKARLTKSRAVVPPDFDAALSTGSTLLNLAYTGRPNSGYVRGCYYFLVGDSDSGKTWCTLTAMAEAANSPAYDGYRLILDNVEGGIQMNLAQHFGRKMADRVEPPCEYQGLPWHSEKIEDFYVNLDTALERGPCFYVLDSMDALSSEDEDKKFVQLKDAKSKPGAEVKGSYGDGKAKKNSAWMRRMLSGIAKTGSIVVVVNQTRDNPTAWFDSKTCSGGHALKFYAQVQAWTSVKGKLTKEVRGSKRHIGNSCELHVERSRFTGHQSTVTVPIYFTSGIDDVGSCVDYLVAEKCWTKEGKIDTKGFCDSGSREKIVSLIEDGNREAELRSLVAQVWVEIESESGVERKKRYQ